MSYIDLDTPKKAYTELVNQLAEAQTRLRVTKQLRPWIEESLDASRHIFYDLSTSKLSLVGNTENLSNIAFCDKFVCKNCGLHLEDWCKIINEEYEDGYIDKTRSEYIFKFCPECGTKITNNLHK